MKVWRQETCIKIQKERRGADTKQRGRQDIDNLSEKRRVGEGVEMVVGVEKMGNCSVDHGCVPGSTRL